METTKKNEEKMYQISIPNKSEYTDEIRDELMQEVMKITQETLGGDYTMMFGFSDSITEPKITVMNEEGNYELQNEEWKNKILEQLK